MGRVRSCNSRCHRARETRCRCRCGGFFHGKDGTGAANRAALAQATEAEQKLLLEQHGFKEAETAYIEQKELGMDNPLVAVTLWFKDGAGLRQCFDNPVPQGNAMAALGAMVAKLEGELNIKIEELPLEVPRRE